MKAKFFYLLAALLTCLLLISSAVLAQEATETLPLTAEETATVEAPPEPTSVAVVDPLPENGDVEFALKGVEIIGIVIASVLTGVTAAGGGFVLVVTKLRSSPAFKDFIERAFLSRPLDEQSKVRKGVEAGREVFDLLDEVTDGKPNEEPPKFK